MNESGIKFVLTISGSDSSGCSGLQADNRSIRAAGAMPLNAITAITLQTGESVLSVQEVDPAIIRSHALALLKAYPVAAIKIGMLASAKTVECVTRVLRAYSDPFVILDPVVRSSSGHELLDEAGIAALNQTLLPYVDLLTPNKPEATLIDRPPKGATLLKGGHNRDHVCRDELYIDGELVKSYCSPRVVTRNDRGTGCALSSGIAAYVAQGYDIATAIGFAKSSLQASLEAGSTLSFNGRGPAFF